MVQERSALRCELERAQGGDSCTAGRSSIHDDSSGFSASADCCIRRYVFSSGKEDILGWHDALVRCVEYSYAAGVFLIGVNMEECERWSLGLEALSTRT